MTPQARSWATPVGMSPPTRVHSALRSSLRSDRTLPLKSPRTSMIDWTNRRIGAAGSIWASASRSRTILCRSDGHRRGMRLAEQHRHRHLVEVGQRLQPREGQRRGSRARRRRPPTRSSARADCSSTSASERPWAWRMARRRCPTDRLKARSASSPIAVRLAQVRSRRLLLPWAHLVTDRRERAHGDRTSVATRHVPSGHVAGLERRRCGPRRRPLQRRGTTRRCPTRASRPRDRRWSRVRVASPLVQRPRPEAERPVSSAALVGAVLVLATAACGDDGDDTGTATTHRPRRSGPASARRPTARRRAPSTSPRRRPACIDPAKTYTATFDTTEGIVHGRARHRTHAEDRRQLRRPLPVEVLRRHRDLPDRERHRHRPGRVAAHPGRRRPGPGLHDPRRGRAVHPGDYGPGAIAMARAGTRQRQRASSSSSGEGGRYLGDGAARPGRGGHLRGVRQGHRGARRREADHRPPRPATGKPGKQITIETVTIDEPSRAPLARQHRRRVVPHRGRGPDRARLLLGHAVGRRRGEPVRLAEGPLRALVAGRAEGVERDGQGPRAAPTGSCRPMYGMKKLDIAALEAAAAGTA